jgi:hypothetical protein
VAKFYSARGRKILRFRGLICHRRSQSKFRDVKTLQKFASVHASVHNHFNLERHLNSRETFKQDRSSALAEWCQQVTRPCPTIPEHAVRHIQQLLCPASFARKIPVQAISNRRIGRLENRDRGGLRISQNGFSRVPPVKVTMPSTHDTSFRRQVSPA